MEIVESKSVDLVLSKDNTVDLYDEQIDTNKAKSEENERLIQSLLGRVSTVETYTNNFETRITNVETNTSQATNTVITQIKSDITNVKNQTNDLKTLVERTNTDVNNIKTDVNNNAGAISNIHNSISTINNNITANKNSLTELNNKYSVLNSGYEAFKRSQENYNLANDTNITDIKANIKILQNKTDNLQTGFNDISEKVLRLQQNSNASYEGRITNIEIANRNLTQQMSTITTKVTNIENNITTLVTPDSLNVYTKDKVYTKAEVYKKDETYSRAEIESKLSGKANTNHGLHLPTLANDVNKFLRSDNTWQTITQGSNGYSKSEADAKFALKTEVANPTNVYNKTEINNKIENLTTVKVQDRRNSETGRELSDKVEFYRSYSGQNAPYTYGNVISIGGDGGSQMFFGWTADNSTGPVYYRSRRDVANDWSGGWRKLAFSSELDSYVKKSGDTMTGDLKFTESNNTHSSIFPSHYYHNLYDGNTVYVHAFPSHHAVATRTKFEFRTADGTSGAWTPHKLDSSGFTTPTLIFSNGGYIGDSKRDAGDAITNNGGANVNIASWFGLGFYSTYAQKYTGTMNLRSGEWRTIGKMRADEGFHVKGDVGLVFSDRGGGWFMSDSTWIRAYGDKNIFTPGRMKADGGFEGKATSAGHADSSAVSDRTVRVENDYKNMRFHWSGQGGQPTWLWGGNDGENMYVYNPSNFTVNRANTSGTADFATKIKGNKLIFENGTELWIE